VQHLVGGPLQASVDAGDVQQVGRLVAAVGFLYVKPESMAGQLGIFLDQLVEGILSSRT
jgi:hypothetical protein